MFLKTLGQIGSMRPLSLFHSLTSKVWMNCSNTFAEMRIATMAEMPFDE